MAKEQNVNAYKDYVIADMGDEIYSERNGVYRPSKALMREMMKTKEKREIGGPGYDNHMREAVVVSVGPLVRDIQVGDKLMLNRHNGEEFGENLIAIREADVAGIMI